MAEEMDNLKLEKALVEYIEGRLDEYARKRMEELLADDGELREQLKQHEKVRDMLTKLKAGADKDAAGKPAASAKAEPDQVEALKGVDFEAQRRQIMAKVAAKAAARKLQAPPDADEAEFRLGQYLDGELNPYRKVELEERLGRDEWLKAQKRLYESLQTQIELYRRPPVGVDYAAQRARIMKAVAELASRNARLAMADHKTARVLYIRPLMAMAAAAAVLILGVVVWFAVRPHFQRPAKSFEAVAMVVPPSIAKDGGRAAVQISPPSWDEVFAPIPVGQNRMVSSGTVLVSIGPAIPDEMQAGGVGLPIGF